MSAFPSESFYDQLVKTTAGHYIFSTDGYHHPFLVTCTWTKLSSESFNLAPGASDPGAQTSNPVANAPGCPIFDSTGNGQPEWHMDFSFNSLHDLGEWRVTCDGPQAQVDPAACFSAALPPCNIGCDLNFVGPYSETVNIFVTVYNDRPTASPNHSPTPAWNTTVNLQANASDPDGGSLDYSWSIIDKPSGSSKTLSSSSSANPSISFNNDDDIGDWEFRVHVDDNEGERRTFTHDFTVPNVPPNVQINGPPSIDALLESIELQISSTSDTDGGTFDIQWDLVSAPATASEAPQSNFSTASSISIPTTDADIGTWEFRVNATDNEGDSDSDTHTIEVLNIPPEINLIGVSKIDVGDTIQVETTIYDDVDGGLLSFEWDIVQAPQSSGIFVQENYFGGSGAAGALLTIPTGPDDAGTWIVRLVATDDDNQPDSELEEEFTILVDGPVDASTLR